MSSIDLELWQVSNVQGQINLDLGAQSEVVSVVGTAAIRSNPGTASGLGIIAVRASLHGRSATAFDTAVVYGATATCTIKHPSPAQAIIPRWLLRAAGATKVPQSYAVITARVARAALIANLKGSLPRGSALGSAGSVVNMNVDWNPKGEVTSYYSGSCPLAPATPALDWRKVGAVVAQAFMYPTVRLGYVAAAPTYLYGSLPDILTTSHPAYGELAYSASMVGSDYSTGVRNWRHTTSGYEEAPIVETAFGSMYRGVMDRAFVLETVLWQSALDLHKTLELLSGVGTDLWSTRISHYEEATYPGYGRHEPPVDPPIPPDVPVLVDIDLDGIHHTGTDLEFSLLGAAKVTIPTKRSYIVSNSVTLQLLPSGVQLNILSLSMDIDNSSWAWGFNFKVHANDAAVLAAAPSPMLMLLTVNGQVFKAVGEKVTTSRKFGSSSLTITARGVSALLDNPYVKDMSFSVGSVMTAQQLMNNVLTDNGVSIGWEIDWRILDWLVIAGAWSLRGSYIDAIKSIAKAAGAYVLPHATDKKLTILPNYPWMPDKWVDQTPDLELPAAVLESEGVKTSVSPNYNAVYVSGSVAGSVVGLVKRTGSAGDVLASTVTDALITAPEAARQRGMSVLGAAGVVKTYTLSLPVMAETGIVQVGSLVRYLDQDGEARLGLVRGVSVSCSALPVVRQTIEVEVHG